MITRAQQREEKRKAVVEAVVVRGEPVHVVRRVFNIPESTIFRWLSLYRAGGWHALKEGRRTGRPRKVSGEDMAWLYRVVTQGNPMQYQFGFCLWTLKALCTLLEKERGIKLSRMALSRTLGHLGLSPQRPIYKSYKQDPNKVQAYLEQTFPQAVQDAKARGARIFFVDEASVRSDAHSGTTWGKVGETPVVADSGGRFGINVISAVSPLGEMRFSCIDGHMNSDTFIAFLKQLHRDAGGPILVVADNARYHHSKQTRAFIESQRGDITLVFLPPYSPELNPDEQVWNHAKRRLGRSDIRSREDMKKRLMSILHSIQKQVRLVKTFFKLPGTKYVLKTLT